ncbi:MAG: twin-arginine translocation signal domain-containing protein, partial [Chloroflexi bacterium]|nr:twin-arginine translocation signal domain-containing protein [Chloroflexota bacterium]
MTHRFKSIPVRSSEITPKGVYLSRRDFIKAAGVVAGSMALAACAPEEVGETTTAPQLNGPALNDELGNPANAYEEITNYNNYYEFT